MSSFVLCLLATCSLVLRPNAPERTGLFKTVDGVYPERPIDLEAVWTTDALVVRVREFLPPGAVPRASGASDRPLSIFERGDSTIEMFMRPFPDGPEDFFYQLSVNPSNVVYSARKPYGASDAAKVAWSDFRKSCSTRTFFGYDHWGVEFVVPFGAFGEKHPQLGEERQFEFYVGPYAWCAQRGGGFGRLVFGGDSPVAAVERATVDKDGVLRLSYAVDCRRQKGEIPHKGIRAFDIGLSCSGEAVSSLKIGAGRGDVDWLRLDRFYYPENEVVLDYSAKSFCRPAVNVRRIATDEIVFSETRPAAGRLCLPGLSCGDYAVEVKENGLCTSCQFEVVPAVPASALEFREGSLRLDGGVLRADAEGRPGCPIFVLAASAEVPGRVGFKAALVSRYLKLPSGLHYRYERSQPLFGAESRLAKFNRPLEIARLAYEAQICAAIADGDSPAAPVADNAGFYAVRYREVKARFPGRLFSIQVDARREIAAYSPSCDIFEFPVPYGANPLLDAKDTFDALDRFASGKPCIIWLGASLPDNGKCRTPDELNTLARYAVLRGAVGCIHHVGHGGIPKENTRLWSYLRDCERRVNDWYPDWIEGVPVAAGAAYEEGVAVRLRRLKTGRLMILGVNLTPTAKEVSLGDPLSGRTRTVRLTGFGSVQAQW